MATRLGPTRGAGILKHAQQECDWSKTYKPNASKVHQGMRARRTSRRDGKATRNIPTYSRKMHPWGKKWPRNTLRAKHCQHSLQPRSGQRKQTPCRQVNNLWK